MSKLHEKDEPLPWAGLPVTGKIVGKMADHVLIAAHGEPHFGIIICNGCGRWQDFPPPHTFDAMNEAATLAGWRCNGIGAGDDLCPICAP